MLRIRPTIRSLHLQVHPVANVAKARFPEYTMNASNNYNLIWRQPPRNVYIVKKPWDSGVRAAMLELIGHLNQEYPAINVLVGEDVADELMHEMSLALCLSSRHEHKLGSNRRVIYTGPIDEISAKAEIVVTLGGDGTTLQAVLAFKDVNVPPILSFSMGTLGFLLPFDFDKFRSTFRTVYESRAKVMYRSRIACHISSYNSKSQKTSLVSEKLPISSKLPISAKSPTSDLNEKDLSTKDSQGLNQKGLHPDQKRLHPDQKSLVPPGSVVYAMNDMVLHRGSEPHLVALDIFIDGEFFTTTTGDGVVLSTPTGSTAYSLSSGGLIVHPQVDCVMITPISPRLLLFRPVLLPAKANIMVRLSEHNRNKTIELTIDGMRQRNMRPGDEIHVSSPGLVLADERNDLPMHKGGIWCVSQNDNDWTRDINDLLGFNSSFLGKYKRKREGGEGGVEKKRRESEEEGE